MVDSNLPLELSLQPPVQLPPDWARWWRRAACALQRELDARGELRPEEVAQTVTGALPDPVGPVLLHRLERLGWLAADAQLPFDLLDGPACPREFSGASREVVRLAVFGLPGQGLAARDKRRQDVYQQICADIMRSAVDERSLEAVAARAMNHPEVSADSILAGLVRSFVAERYAALRGRVSPTEQHQLRMEESKLRGGFRVRGCEYPTPEEVQAARERLVHDLETAVGQHDIARAEYALDKLRDLRRRYPVHVAAQELQQCEEQFDELLRRVATYQRQIRELAERGKQAARDGDEDAAGWIARRLQALHMLMPTILAEQELEKLLAAIDFGEQEHDTRVARQALLSQERAVAAQIKRLAAVVQRFHQLAQRLPPEDTVYQRAEQEYLRAVAEIRTLNTEWLTGLMLQLEALLDDLDDPDGQIQSQLDVFIAKVRQALNRLCLEIRTWRARQAAEPNPAPAPPVERRVAEGGATA